MGVLSQFDDCSCFFLFPFFLFARSKESTGKNGDVTFRCETSWTTASLKFTAEGGVCTLLRFKARTSGGVGAASTEPTTDKNSQNS